jgi:pantothenate kinase
LALSVAKLLTTVCATGGGAFKFEEEFHKVSDDEDNSEPFNEAECIIFNLSCAGGEHAAAEIR